MSDEIQIKGLNLEPDNQNVGNQGAGVQNTGQSAGQQAMSAGQATTTQSTTQADMQGTIQGGQASQTTGGQVSADSSALPSAGQSSTGQTSAGQSSAGQTSVGQSSAGQSSSDQSSDITIGQNAGQTGQASGQTALTPQKPQKKTFSLADELNDEALVQAPPEKYAIPSLVKEKFPDLVDLIKTTESMSDDEREYWFQILPIMTEEQIKKFRDILVNEKEQLAKLDSEYEEELNRLNEKHMIEWKEFESKEKRRALTEAEASAEQQEKQTEEDLLAKLGQL